jgi:hypothetical protein
VKYLILIYSNPATWAQPPFLHQHDQLPPQERAGRLEQFRTLMTEIARSGELVNTATLEDPARSRTVRFREGALAVTDGPFADAQEQLAGYFVVDCATPERAAEIAARCADARHGGAVELRPVVDFPRMEL